MARVEWMGSLYLRDKKPCLPGELIEGCVFRAAASKKRSNDAKAAIFCLGSFFLTYEGPKDINALWEIESYRLAVMVRVGAARIQRTRPIFREWAAVVEIQMNPEILNPSDVKEFLTIGGSQKGIGDWRPRFGRFAVAAI